MPARDQSSAGHPVARDPVLHRAGGGHLQLERDVAVGTLDGLGARPRRLGRADGRRRLQQHAAGDRGGRGYSNQSVGCRTKKLRMTSSTSESAGREDQRSM